MDVSLTGGAGVPEGVKQKEASSTAACKRARCLSLGIRCRSLELLADLAE